MLLQINRQKIVAPCYHTNSFKYEWSSRPTWVRPPSLFTWSRTQRRYATKYIECKERKKNRRRSRPNPSRQQSAMKCERQSRPFYSSCVLWWPCSRKDHLLKIACPSAPTTAPSWSANWNFCSHSLRTCSISDSYETVFSIWQENHLASKIFSRACARFSILRPKQKKCKYLMRLSKLTSIERKFHLYLGTNVALSRY